MSTPAAKGPLLRSADPESQRVTTIELFFDLVYVFAITQLSHRLVDHLTWVGALQTAILLMAVWQAWVNTTWVTSWFSPDKDPVRTLLISVMLGSLVISATIPEAFEGRGLAFALVYAVLSVLRSGFVIVNTGEDPGLRRNFQRIFWWGGSAAALWVVGGLLDGNARLAVWLAAVALEYAGPAMGFAVPGLGRSTTDDWVTIAGGHLAERCQLFIIVALGESILVTGTTVADLPFRVDTAAAALTAFLGSVALWWIYFDKVAEHAGNVIEESDDPGRLGRSGYTYVHVPMVAGIIVTAVGDELAIAHPSGHADDAAIAVILGGPALFLLGHALFK
jgi:low temperature requirement protein LtrA